MTAFMQVELYWDTERVACINPLKATGRWPINDAISEDGVISTMRETYALMIKKAKGEHGAFLICHFQLLRHTFAAYLHRFTGLIWL